MSAGGRLRIEPAADEALDAHALVEPAQRDLIRRLHDELGPVRRRLLAARGRLGADAAELTVDGMWELPPAPADLQRRRVEITGPPEPRMAAYALASGADVWMGDLEDATSPTWDNIVRGHGVLRDAFVRRSATQPTIVARPRGIHLVEGAVTVDAEPVAAAIVDVVLWSTGSHRDGAGAAPYVYLPKIETADEAAWWARLLSAVDGARADRLVSRASVLVETLPAALQMDAILFELRHHACALNAGRWDYLFSAIKRRPAGSAVFPDRSALGMRVPFLQAYAEQIVARAHARGAHAIGGMAAAVPSRRDAAQTERALARVREDKQREASQGFDGSWVAHPDLVPVCADVFAEALGDEPHQIRSARGRVHPASRLLDFRVPDALVTADGVRGNVRVALEYLRAWFDGRGAIAIDGLMEDAATAEIARAQLWEWARESTLGSVASVAEIERLTGEEGSDSAAADALRRAVFADPPPEFLPEAEGTLLRTLAARD